MTPTGSFTSKSRAIRNSRNVAQIVIANLLIATTAIAATPSAGDDSLFKRLDKNQNNSISADEITAANERLFARLLRKGNTNDDRTLSRKEFMAALVPSRPEKPMEPKEPSTFPQADAVRYLLVSLDANADTLITPDEIRDDLQPVFDVMVERIDRNNNGRLERYELARSAPPLAQIAGRYVEREDIDVAAELKKLEKEQGSEIGRFEEQQNPMEAFSNPRRAEKMFAQLDGNSNGKLDPDEIPEPLQQPLERLTRLADRDRDGRLSKSEFLDGAERLSRYFGRRPGDMFNRDAKPDDSMPAPSKPAKSKKKQD